MTTAIIKTAKNTPSLPLWYKKIIITTTDKITNIIMAEKVSQLPVYVREKYSSPLV